MLDRARRLDDRVLGPSDSRRGYLANLYLLRLHPGLWPVYAAVAVGSAVLVVVGAVRGDAELAVPAGLSALVNAGWARTSRRLPRRPRR